MNFHQFFQANNKITRYLTDEADTKLRQKHRQTPNEIHAEQDRENGIAKETTNEKSFSFLPFEFSNRKWHKMDAIQCVHEYYLFNSLAGIISFHGLCVCVCLNKHARVCLYVCVCDVDREI